MCVLASGWSLVQCCHYVMCMRVNIKKSQKKEVRTIEKVRKYLQRTQKTHRDLEEEMYDASGT